MPTLDELRLFAKYHLIRRVVDHPAPETELGIVSLGYEPAEYARTIETFADRFEVSTLGEVDYEGRAHPILEVHVRAENPKKKLLVLAGVHGNEHAGLLAVPDLLEALCESRPSDVDIRFVTPVNPVGAAHLSRYNARGFDINRDFVRFETPEARIVRDVTEAMRPDFAIALHEGPQDATFMFTNRLVPDALAVRALEAMQAGGTVLAEENYFGSTLRPAGLSPMTATGWAVSALWAGTLKMMATGMWFNERGVPEITLESSWRLPGREARVRGHVDLVLAIARGLSSDP